MDASGSPEKQPPDFLLVEILHDDAANSEVSLLCGHHMTPN